LKGNEDSLNAGKVQISSNRVQKKFFADGKEGGPWYVASKKEARGEL